MFNALQEIFIKVSYGILEHILQNYYQGKPLQKIEQ